MRLLHEWQSILEGTRHLLAHYEKFPDTKIDLNVLRLQKAEAEEQIAKLLKEKRDRKKK